MWLSRSFVAHFSIKHYYFCCFYYYQAGRPLHRKTEHKANRQRCNRGSCRSQYCHRCFSCSPAMSWSPFCLQMSSLPSAATTVSWLLKLQCAKPSHVLLSRAGTTRWWWTQRCVRWHALKITSMNPDGSDNPTEKPATTYYLPVSTLWGQI